VARLDRQQADRAGRIGLSFAVGLGHDAQAVRRGPASRRPARPRPSRRTPWARRGDTARGRDGTLVERRCCPGPRIGLCHDSGPPRGPTGGEDGGPECAGHRALSRPGGHLRDQAVRPITSGPAARDWRWGRSRRPTPDA
jgi:hypothetical protein